MNIRLPNVMLPYACQRTLVCCRPPWRVWLGSTDQVELQALADAEGRSARELDDWFDSSGGGQALLAQDRRGCCLLDAETPACRLQRRRGLKALPAQCRNFPRSVVRRPDGTEAAFLLDCPTVAALVCDQPPRFALVDWPGSDWPYRSYSDAPASLRLREGEDVALESLDVLRAAWWQRLGKATAASLVEALEDLACGCVRSDEGRVRSRPFGPPPGLAARVISALPARGSSYATHRDELSATLPQIRRSDIIGLVERRVGPIACAASLCIQLAGLHDGRTVARGLQMAGQLVLFALEVCATLTTLELADELEALADGLTASSHIMRLSAAHGVLLD